MNLTRQPALLYKKKLVIFILFNQSKSPLVTGGFRKKQTYEKETYAFRLTDLLAGVSGSTFLEGSLARGGTG